MWNSSSSGFSQQKKQEVLEGAIAGAQQAHVPRYDVRISERPCIGPITYQDGVITVCDDFFYYYQSRDQGSMLWREFYRKGYPYGGRTEQMRVPGTVVLKPSGDLQTCLEKQLDKYRAQGDSVYRAKLKSETEFQYIYHSEWYEHELKIYRAEVDNDSLYYNRSERYLCELRWKMWQLESLKSVAKKMDGKE